MSSQNDVSSSIDGESENDGYEPQAKKRKLFLSDATRAETYLVMTGRVHLSMISWMRPLHRGARDIMPEHVHEIAAKICTIGTSQRLYAPVKLVEVPERFRARWASANQMKAATNPLLANFQAVSHTEPMYATLRGSHFVEAQKLVGEGGRRFRDQPDGIRLQLTDSDCEGRLIQSHGVVAFVYSAELWEDSAAMIAMLREGNLDIHAISPDTEALAGGYEAVSHNLADALWSMRL